MNTMEAIPARFDIHFEATTGMFSGEGMPGVPGYWHGQRWNGWACPFFGIEAAKQIVAAPCWNGKGEYDEAAGVFRTPYEDGGDEMDEWPAQEITVDGQLVKVWAIGHSCWTWEQIGDFDRTPTPACEAPPKCADCNEPLGRCCGSGTLTCLMCNPCPNCSDQ